MSPFSRRGFITRVGVVGVAAALAPDLVMPGGLLPRADAATWRKRLTGADLDTNRRWQVAGTDLGIPYVLGTAATGVGAGPARRSSTAASASPP